MLFRIRKTDYEVIQEEKRIKSILSEFRDTNIVKVYKSEVGKDFMILIKKVTYKIRPLNPNYKEKVSEKIIEINYYKL